MALYLEGKPGAGKSLVAIGMIKDYLMRGRPVATNMDIYFHEWHDKYFKKLSCYRLPDYPSSQDLNSLGYAYNGDYDETKNGLIVLDECSRNLNSRTWSEKIRLDMILWFSQYRKFCWDLILIVQDVKALDSQLRECTMELKGHCYNSKKTGWLSWVPWQFHLCVIRSILDKSDVVLERMAYRVTDIKKLYNTRQQYSPVSEFQWGTYSYLSPWHLVGRYIVQVSLHERLVYLLKTIFYLFVLLRPSLLPVFFQRPLARRSRIWPPPRTAFVKSFPDKLAA